MDSGFRFHQTIQRMASKMYCFVQNTVHVNKELSLVVGEKENLNRQHTEVHTARIVDEQYV
jgi:hypothetical protein